MIRKLLLCPSLVICSFLCSNGWAQLYIGLDYDISDTFEYYIVDNYNLGEISNGVISESIDLPLNRISTVTLVINNQIGLSLVKAPGDSIMLKKDYPYLSASDSAVCSWLNASIEAMKINDESYRINKESVLSSVENLYQMGCKLVSDKDKKIYSSQLKIVAMSMMLKQYIKQLMDKSFEKVDDELREDIINALNDTSMLEFNSSYNLANWFVALERNQFKKSSTWEACDELGINYVSRQRIMSYLYNIYLLGNTKEIDFPEEYINKYSLTAKQNSNINSLVPRY